MERVPLNQCPPAIRDTYIVRANQITIYVQENKDGAESYRIYRHGAQSAFDIWRYEGPLGRRKWVKHAK